MKIEKWIYPDSYVGPDHSDCYVGLGQNRDSDALTRSNFRVSLEMLGGESLCECENARHCKCAVQVVRDSHWACGWIEYILVHESASDKIKILNDIAEELDVYPVLDESDWSQEEENEMEQTIESNSGEFRREVLKFLEFKTLSYNGGTNRPKRLGQLDEFVSAVFHEAVGYSGLENAWVSARSIERLVESKYPPYGELTKNIFYRLCKAKLNSAD